jgi:SagB-type dehydrogenase family enzyme
LSNKGKGIGSRFIKETSFTGIRVDDLEKSDQTLGKPQPRIQEPYNQWKKTIMLKKPGQIKVRNATFKEILEQRRSVRNYSEKPLNMDELSWLLWCTQGVQQTTPQPRTYRTVPSAGGRHPYETYLAIGNVEDLTPGLYRYLALEHQLLFIEEDGEILEKVTEYSWNQQFIKKSAVVFIWVFIPNRTVWRFNQRGYRNIIEAGHICQNLYLSAEAIDCGACAIICFGDQKLNNLVGVDGEEQLVIYLATIGKKPE